MGQTTRNSKVINATAQTIYEAFTNPTALETWQAPGDMTAKVHNFELKVGGGYEMSLFYPEAAMEGKTQGNEDRFKAKFIELTPNKKIVQVVNFESTDPGFEGAMTIEITFEPMDERTRVTYFFQNIPKGIKPEDNEEGTILTLEKLAKYVENN